jgi:hypothetical protein
MQRSRRPRGPHLAAQRGPGASLADGAPSMFFEPGSGDHQVGTRTAAAAHVSKLRIERLRLLGDSRRGRRTTGTPERAKTLRGSQHFADKSGSFSCLGSPLASISIARPAPIRKAPALRPVHTRQLRPAGRKRTIRPSWRPFPGNIRAKGGKSPGPPAFRNYFSIGLPARTRPRSALATVL